MNSEKNLDVPLTNFGSNSLNKMVAKLQSTKDKKKGYEYILWIAKKLPPLESDHLIEETKVNGCISEVYVLGEVINGKMQWKGFSDALITRGLLAFLVEGLKNLTPEEVVALKPDFIAATGLQGSLTPSRANGFLNILLAMQAQAQTMCNGDFSTSS